MQQELQGAQGGKRVEIFVRKKSSQKPQGGNQGNRKKNYHCSNDQHQNKKFDKKKGKDCKNKPKSR